MRQTASPGPQEWKEAGVCLPFLKGQAETNREVRSIIWVCLLLGMVLKEQQEEQITILGVPHFEMYHLSYCSIIIIGEVAATAGCERRGPLFTPPRLHQQNEMAQKQQEAGRSLECAAGDAGDARFLLAEEERKKQEEMERRRGEMEEKRRDACSSFTWAKL